MSNDEAFLSIYYINEAFLSIYYIMCINKCYSNVIDKNIYLLSVDIQQFVHRYVIFFEKKVCESIA